MPHGMGGLLDAVLRGIDDNAPVADRMDRSEALKTLIDGYQQYTHNDATLPSINSLTTGAELKWAIALLNPHVQVTLLKKYSDTVLGVPTVPVIPMEAPHVTEERRLRHWFLKFLAWLATSIIVVMTLAVVSTIVKSNSLPDGSIFSSIMSTAVEILKLVFSTGIK